MGETHAAEARRSCFNWPVGWHELLAADSEKAWTFYNEVFGWQRAEAEVGEMGTYQLFSSRGQTMGGIVTKASVVPSARWLYYFNVSDINSAAERVKTEGGQILSGPIELPSGNAMVQCKDPQGAIFALGVSGAAAPSDISRTPTATSGHGEVVNTCELAAS